MKNNENKATKKLAVIAAGSFLVGGMIAPQGANATNMFDFESFGSGSEVRAELLPSAVASTMHLNIEAACGEKATDGKTTEAKCGEKGKAKEAKCGEKGKAKEAKCGEKATDAKGKAKEAKCGEKGKAKEAKCGEKGKAKEAKCGEKGKSGEATCGEK